MKRFVAWVQSEAAFISYFVQQALVLVTAFGLDMTKDQVVAVNLFTGSVLMMFTRQSVTPNVKLPPLSKLNRTS